MDQKTLDLYNPYNAKNLTDTHISAMESFTAEDIAALAQAYPNTASPSGAYLTLRDTRAKGKQIYSLATWENLNALYKAGQTHLVANGFKALNRAKPVTVKSAPLQDITKQEAKSALTVATPQTAKVATAKSEPVKTAEAQTAKPKEPKEKTAKQIADAEAKALAGAEDFNAAEATKAVLEVKYKELFGKAPGKNVKVPELRKKVIAELNKK